MLIVHWRFIVSLLSYFLLWPCFPEVLPLIQHWICRTALFSWVNTINQHSWQDKMIAVYIFSANHTYIVDICTKHVHMNWFSHWVAGGRDSGGVPGRKANDSGLKPAFKHFSSLKPLAIFTETSGQFPAVFVGDKRQRKIFLMRSWSFSCRVCGKPSMMCFLTLTKPPIGSPGFEADFRSGHTRWIYLHVMHRGIKSVRTRFTIIIRIIRPSQDEPQDKILLSLSKLTRH